MLITLKATTMSFATKRVSQQKIRLTLVPLLADPNLVKALPNSLAVSPANEFSEPSILVSMPVQRNTSVGVHLRFRTPIAV